MRIYYQNNFGQSVDFMGWPYNLASSTDLHDYVWNYDNRSRMNPKITRFYRELTARKMEISVSAGTMGEYNKALEYLLEVTERDVLNLTPGRLYVDEYYLPCYIHKSQKTSWMEGAAFLVNTFSVVSEKGAWIRESKSLFSARGQAPAANEDDLYLDYPFEYPYDYASIVLGRVVQNQGYASADFELTICGPCKDPEVIIAGHGYKVGTTLESGELLLINSLQRRVYKVLVNGEEVNQFHLRNRESYIFEKIPEGECAVVWNGSFAFYVTIFEERSEPRWT